MYAWYSGFIIFNVSFHAYTYGPINKVGMQDGLWTEGCASFTILVACHHAIIFIATKNYGVYIIVFYVLSVLCYFPISCMLMQLLPGTM